MTTHADLAARVDFLPEQGRVDHAAALALFLLEKTGSIWGYWRGRMTAAEQRALFGRFIGKGEIVIDGEEETLANSVSVCFGTMRDRRNITDWRSL